MSKNVELVSVSDLLHQSAAIVEWVELSLSTLLPELDGSPSNTQAYYGLSITLRELVERINFISSFVDVSLKIRVPIR